MNAVFITNPSLNDIGKPRIEMQTERPPHFSREAPLSGRPEGQGESQEGV